MIAPAAPPPELGLGAEPRTRVSIFMNVFDCHVNRAPAGGRVAAVAYHPGKFLNASLDKAVAIKKGWFALGEAKQKDDFFIAKKVNAKTYKLFFDADGSGKGKALEIATVKLQKGEGTTLTHKDFFFV